VTEKKIDKRLEAMRTVLLEIKVFWNVVLCRLLYNYQISKDCISFSCSSSSKALYFLYQKLKGQGPSQGLSTRRNVQEDFSLQDRSVVKWHNVTRLPQCQGICK